VTLVVTFEQLEEASIPLSARLVGEFGGFLPIAVVAGPDGALEQVGTDVGSDDPTPLEVYEFLEAALRAGARQGRYSAVALVLNESPPDDLELAEERSIHAFIDIQGVGARSVYVPYTQDAGGDLTVGATVRVDKASYFFP
jgi:hypothetical protein